MPKTFSAIIADDESLLRRHLESLLETYWPELEIVATAANGEEALKIIQQHQPDIAFLDIRMPVLDGISLANRFVELKSAPLTIFVTAYDQHAIAAFEKGAVDYLLKPIDEERLQKCIERIQQRLSHIHQTEQGPLEAQEQLQNLLTQLSGKTNATPEPLKWIKASKQDAIHLVDIENVICFVAESKYTTVVTEEGEYIIRLSIKALTQQLDTQLFWQVHRNAIVNVKQIAQVEKDFSGHMFVHLKHEKKRLTVSRSFQHVFKQM